MQLYDPTVTGPERNFARAPALSSLEGKTIGILENGKLNAENMLREIALLFEARRPRPQHWPRLASRLIS